MAAFAHLVRGTPAAVDRVAALVTDLAAEAGRPGAAANRSAHGGLCDAEAVGASPAGGTVTARQLSSDPVTDVTAVGASGHGAGSKRTGVEGPLASADVADAPGSLGTGSAVERCAAAVADVTAILPVSSRTGHAGRAGGSVDRRRGVRQDDLGRVGGGAGVRLGGRHATANLAGALTAQEASQRGYRQDN